MGHSIYLVTWQTVLRDKSFEFCGHSWKIIEESLSLVAQKIFFIKSWRTMIVSITPYLLWISLFWSRLSKEDQNSPSLVVPMLGPERRHSVLHVFEILPYLCWKIIFPTLGCTTMDTNTLPQKKKKKKKKKKKFNK